MDYLKDSTWNDWFERWQECYPHDWTTKIIDLQDTYDNVYTDIAYLSGDKEEVFIELLSMLRDDAQNGKGAGKILADRLILGTDWYMTELDKMSAHTFWVRIRRVLTDIESPLWKKWTSENALRWLNLRDRLRGKGLKWLEQFYKANMPATGTAPVLLPSWWKSLEPFYASRSR